MNSENDAARELTDLLREAEASPRVCLDRITRSTLYDLDYHIALIACVFFTPSGRDLTSLKHVSQHWLKILQFIAVRPSLLPNFLAWAKTRRGQDLNTWQKMPRGYLGDSTHDRTVELLVAFGALARTGDSLVGGNRFEVLRSVYDKVVAIDLLHSERATLEILSQLPENKTLLKGI